MKHHFYVHVVVVGLCATIIVSLTQSWRGGIPNVRHKKFSIIFDELLTDSIKKDIERGIEDLGRQHTFVPARLAHVLSENIPIISVVETCVVEPGCVELKVRARRPSCTINTTHVLVGSKLICPTSWYHEEVYRGLPDMSVPDLKMGKDQAYVPSPSAAHRPGGHYEPAELAAIFEKMSPEMFKGYNVVVGRGQEIHLNDKTEPKLSLVCRCSDLATRHVCAAGKVARDMLKNDPAFKSSASRTWVADLRFKNQIVVHEA